MKSGDIINLLTDSLDSSEIYFMDIPPNFCGITLYNGYIVIKKKYYDDLQDMNVCVHALATILITILHELTHVLLRLIKKGVSPKYSHYLVTEKFTNGTKEYTDSGELFDDLLTGIMDGINLNQAVFLLDIQNYNCKDFNQQFMHVKPKPNSRYPFKTVNRNQTQFKYPIRSSITLTQETGNQDKYKS